MGYEDRLEGWEESFGGRARQCTHGSCPARKGEGKEQGSTIPARASSHLATVQSRTSALARQPLARAAKEGRGLHARQCEWLREHRIKVPCTCHSATPVPCASHAPLCGGQCLPASVAQYYY